MVKHNILVLDADPVRSAQAHTDDDLMALGYEYMLTLELAHLAVNGGPLPHHVIAKWAMKDDNWWWLARMVMAMQLELEYRFGGWSSDLSLDHMIHEDDDGPDTRPPRFLQLIPEKLSGRAVEAYRQHYHKEVVPCWTRRGAPEWWQGSEQYSLL